MGVIFVFALTSYPCKVLNPCPHRRVVLFSVLAARSLTNLVEAFPRGASQIANHSALVSELCAKLMNIEHMDLAEQCLLVRPRGQSDIDSPLISRPIEQQLLPIYCIS